VMWLSFSALALLVVLRCLNGLLCIGWHVKTLLTRGGTFGGAAL